MKSETQNGNCADGGQDKTGGKEDVTTTTEPPLTTTKGVKVITTTESETDNCKGRTKYVQVLLDISILEPINQPRSQLLTSASMV